LHDADVRLCGELYQNRNASELLPSIFSAARVRAPLALAEKNKSEGLPVALPKILFDDLVVELSRIQYKDPRLCRNILLWLSLWPMLCSVKL